MKNKSRQQITLENMNENTNKMKMKIVHGK